MDSREQFQQRVVFGRFTCNVCGAGNESNVDVANREGATCASCRSSMRFRSILLVLSRALFGTDLPLCEFPRLKSVRGLGISDSPYYSDRLERSFSYTNTFYHREPAFDLLQPDESEIGKYDFVICSEVLEHVTPPVDRAFQTLARILKPAGVLLLTVPYTLADFTVEHFPSLHHTGLTEIDGRPVLVNRAVNGEYEVFDQLAFHSGHGSTIEMRVFSEADVRSRLTAAGFAKVRFEAAGNQKFGVVFDGPCSLPIVATRGPFSLGGSGIGELVEQLAAARALLKAVKDSRWVRLGRLFGLGPRLRPPY